MRVDGRDKKDEEKTLAYAPMHEVGAEAERQWGYRVQQYNVIIDIILGG